MQEYRTYNKDANETILRSLNNFLTNANDLSKVSDNNYNSQYV